VEDAPEKIEIDGPAHRSADIKTKGYLELHCRFDENEEED